MPRLTGRKPAPLADPNEVADQPVDLVANTRFFLTWNAKCWTILNGQVVPELGRLPLKPGVSLVDAKGRYRQAAAFKAERGWKVIPENVRNPEDPEETYLRVHDGKGGDYWATEWEIVYPGSSQVESDVEGYVAFLRDLMDRGVIARPEPYILREMRSKLSSRQAALQDLAATVPSAAVGAAKLQERIDAIDRELALIAGKDEDEEPKAKSKGRKPAAKAGEDA